MTREGKVLIEEDYAPAARTELARMMILMTWSD